MRRENIIHIFSLFIGLLFTSAVTLLPVAEYSIPWFILKVIQWINATIITEVISRFLFLPPSKPPEVPIRISAFDEAILGAKYNFCSTSTKEIALWESPTFLYYLNLNTLRMMSEKAKGLTEIVFSNDPNDKRKFYEEGRQLVEDFANRRVDNILSKFVAIRFFIYPEKVYKDKEKQIETLISIQAIGSIYCIPIIREKLLSRLTEVEKQRLQELSSKLSQKIEDEFTSLSRWEKVVLKRTKENNPYASSLPDFLIIDAYGKSSSSSVRWYIENQPVGSSEEALIQSAEECFSLLAKIVNESWESVVWQRYHPDLFTRVTVLVKIPIMVTFFAKNYYGKWLHEIVPKHPKLKKWIEKEEEILKQIVRENKVSSALDIGCGWGRQMEILLSEGVKFCAGVDIEPSMLEKARNLYDKFGKDRVLLLLENATKLAPFKDEFFDLVICTTNTFGNMPFKEREEAIKQIYRVLKKDGIFILSVYANTLEAKRLREESYKEVGLRPYPTDDPTVIQTQEGLYSKQFDWKEIESYLKEFKRIEKKIDIDEIAFITIARK